MTPTFCMTRHDPPHSYGDCLRACIASLFDMDAADVPNFADGDADSIAGCRLWLVDRGTSLFLTQYSSDASDVEVRQCVAALNPNIHYLLFSANHVVICRNDKIVHDPAWYRTALKVPDEAWTVGVLVTL